MQNCLLFLEASNGFSREARQSSIGGRCNQSQFDFGWIQTELITIKLD